MKPHSFSIEERWGGIAVIQQVRGNILPIVLLISRAKSFQFLLTSVVVNPVRLTKTDPVLPFDICKRPANQIDQFVSATTIVKPSLCFSYCRAVISVRTHLIDISRGESLHKRRTTALTGHERMALTSVAA